MKMSIINHKTKIKLDNIFNLFSIFSTCIECEPNQVDENPLCLNNNLEVKRYIKHTLQNCECHAETRYENKTVSINSFVKRFCNVI